MGTKNKAVTAYLPEDIETQLAAFCLENGLSRQGKKSGKDKPALGTGIIEVLRLFFSANAHDRSITDLNQDELQTIISRNLPSTVPTKAWVKTEIQQAISALKAEFPPPSTDAQTTAVTIAETVNSDATVSLPEEKKKIS